MNVIIVEDHKAFCYTCHLVVLSFNASTVEMILCLVCECVINKLFERGCNPFIIALSNLLVFSALL